MTTAAAGATASSSAAAQTCLAPLLRRVPVRHANYKQHRYLHRWYERLSTTAARTGTAISTVPSVLVIV